MRDCQPSSAVTVFAVIGTLAIFLLPLPCATAPYPVTHGPGAYLRVSVALLIVVVLTILLFFRLSAECLPSSLELDQALGLNAHFPGKAPVSSLLRC